MVLASQTGEERRAKRGEDAGGWGANAKANEERLSRKEPRVVQSESRNDWARTKREGRHFSWLAKLSPLRVCAHQVGIVLPLSTPQPCRWRILPLAWRRDIPCGSAHQVARPEEFGRRCTIKCGLVLSGEKRIFVWKENLFSLFVTSARTPRAKAQPFKN